MIKLAIAIRADKGEVIYDREYFFEVETYTRCMVPVVTCVTTDHFFSLRFATNTVEHSGIEIGFLNRWLEKRLNTCDKSFCAGISDLFVSRDY